MKTYTFLIGTADDFESLDELIEHFENSSYLSSICNCSAFEFEAPDGCDEDTVTMIGRGIAFSNDWSMDDTYSCLVNGPLDGDAEKEMFEAGLAAREEANRLSREDALRRSQSEYDPNDPVTW